MNAPREGRWVDGMYVSATPVRAARGLRARTVRTGRRRWVPSGWVAAAVVIAALWVAPAWWKAAIIGGLPVTVLVCGVVSHHRHEIDHPSATRRDRRKSR